MDLVFVLDSSGSIRDGNPKDGSYDNWQLLLNFVVNVISELRISEDDTRVGIVKFSDIGEKIFYLNTYYNKEDMIDAVRRISYVGSNTNTVGGLRKMKYNQFQRDNGDRDDVADVAVVITDGFSTINSQQTIPEAADAQRSEIRMYAIGITNKTNLEEVKMLSSDPRQEGTDYWRSKDFTTLDDILSNLVNTLCSTAVISDGEMMIKLLYAFGCTVTQVAKQDVKAVLLTSVACSLQWP